MSNITSQEIQARVEGKTVPDLFLATVAERGDAVALRWKNDDDSWGEMTFNEWADQVARVAGGLKARGVSHGDRVMLMMRNIPEFHVADLACLFLGATPISIYNSSHPEQIAYLTNKSKATTAILEDVGFLEGFLKVRDELDTLQHICLIKDADGAADPDSTWADLLASDPVDLAEAAKVGSVTARALTARPRDQRHYLYPGERVWTNPFIEGRYDFLMDGATMLDSRIYMHFYATGITPAMAIRNVGVGSQYAIAYLDEDGNALDGSRTYKVHLPPNVPAKDFWSCLLYTSDAADDNRLV